MSEEKEFDVSEPIYNEEGRRLPRTVWQKGKSANPAGRPKAGTEKNPKGKPRSKMRNTLSKVYSLEGIAVENIDKFLKMEEGDLTPLQKNQLDMSKWVVKTIESLNTTCLREEMLILGLREKNKEAADEVEDSQSVEPAGQNFSLEMAEETLVKH